MITAIHLLALAAAASLPAGSIRKDSETYRVHRALVAPERLDELRGDARFIAAGHGWTVAGLRAHDPLEQLGLRNGDIVETINGRPADAAALQKALHTTRVVVGIQRHGAPMRMIYIVQKLAFSPEPAPDRIPNSELEAGIRKVGDGEFEVARKLIDRLIDQGTMLNTRIRFVPEIEDGSPVGFAIYGVQARSFYDRLGVSSGDVVRSINGFDLNSPDKVLTCYASLRSTSDVQVALTHAGTPYTITIHLK